MTQQRTAANKSMEALQILQWCQEIDLPRLATNEGLGVYKEASRFLPNKEAQTEIPKYFAIQFHMDELLQEINQYLDSKDFRPEVSERLDEIEAVLARLKPEYDSLQERLRGKGDQVELCKAYRRTLRENQAKAQAAELASLEAQTGPLDTTDAEAALQATTNESGQQRLGPPGNSPWSLNSRVRQNTGLQDP